MESLEWTLRFMSSLPALGMFWVWVNISVVTWAGARWTNDWSYCPAGVRLYFTDQGAANLQAKGYDVPEPWELQPVLLWRHLGRRERVFMCFVPPGTCSGIQQGVVGVELDRPLVKHAVLRLEEAPDEVPPRRKPRGGPRIPAWPLFRPIPRPSFG